MFKIAQLSDFNIKQQHSGLCLVAYSKEEISIICQEDFAPKNCVALSSNWRLMKFTGTLDDNHIGIVGAIMAPLAEVEISVIVNTTYDAGYFGIKATDLQKAIEVLKINGIQVEKEIN